MTERHDDYLENREMIENLSDVEDEALADLADLFKIFADSTRVRILYTLFKHEMNVQDISNELGMNQSAISHQLRILRQANLVKTRRDGKAVVYRLADSHVFTIFAQGLEHIYE